MEIALCWVSFCFYSKGKEYHRPRPGPSDRGPRRPCWRMTCRPAQRRSRRILFLKRVRASRAGSSQGQPAAVLRGGPSPSPPGHKRGESSVKGLFWAPGSPSWTTGPGELPKRPPQIRRSHTSPAGPFASLPPAPPPGEGCHSHLPATSQGLPFIGSQSPLPFPEFHGDTVSPNAYPGHLSPLGAEATDLSSPRSGVCA